MNVNHSKTIGIISQYFYPDPSSTGRLLTDLATGLKEKGNNVFVYTGHPSFWHLKKKSIKYEHYQGINIVRVFSTQLDNRKKIGQLLNAISFTISVFFKLLLNKEVKLFFIVTNPPFLPFIGPLLKKIKKIEYITIVYDMEPDLLILGGHLKKGFFTNIWMKFDEIYYKNSFRIVVIGRCMKDRVCQLLKGYNSEKIEIIPNWEDEKFIKSLRKEDNWFAKENKLVDKFIVLYSGNMSVHHDLDCIVEAAQILRDKNISFLFIGDGIKKESLQTKTKQLGLDNVLFLPFQSFDTLPFSITSGDIHIVSQIKGSEGLCVSCKLYSTLATGKPIIALIGKNSEISKVISECNCGFVIDSYNPEDLANAINRLATDKKLLEQMGLNARTCFVESYTKNHAIDKYQRIVKEFQSTMLEEYN
jgi:glycosyltransferase involved in cell wall biosynthesis